MKKITPILLLIGLAALSAGCAQQEVLQVKDIGSKHVGGRAFVIEGMAEKEITFSPGSPPMKLNPNGEFAVEQMYLQYVRLAAPKAKYPMLLMHGGGLTGVTWETKPDGQAGWQAYFLRAGHDVMVSDAVERGRASWARSPEVFKGEPVFRTKKEGWELFRFGPAGSWNANPSQSKSYPDTQFPVAHFEQFMKQGVPRWLTTDVAVQKAYNTLAQSECPCVIVTHSQGGNFAFNMALAYPEKIKAVVALEPSGFPDPDINDLSRLRGIPHLFVWGDHIADHALWSRIRSGPEKYRNALVKVGVKAETLDLPARGMKGNSHMLMMDRNSDEIAALVQQWLSANGLMK
jgi:pimeloyl-ACP methyl ester carboxylesterase